MELQQLSHNQLSRLELVIERTIYERSFYEFFKVAFCQLHPGKALDDNWHIKYLCDVLQEETFRIVAKKPRTKDIIINIPPRSLKSYLVSVIWPVWSWTVDPSLKVATISYADDIALILSRLSKNLINSVWFQTLYGKKVVLKTDVSGAGHYETTATGIRKAIGMAGGITGLGFDILICLRGDQKIMTDQGEIEIKKIVEEQLKVKILTVNKSGKLQYRRILKYKKNELGKKRMMKITTKSGKEIVCTEDHEIWIENRGYVLARQLTKQDILKVFN